MLLAAAQMFRQWLELWQELPASTSIQPRMGSVIGQITDMTARSSPAWGQPTAFLWLMELFGLRDLISHLSSSPPKPALDDPPEMRRV